MQNQEAMDDGARALSDRSRRGLPSPRSAQECARGGTVPCLGQQSAVHGAQGDMCAAPLLRSRLFGKSLDASSPQSRRLARQGATRGPLLWTASAGLPLRPAKAGLPLIKRPRLRQQWRGRVT